MNELRLRPDRLQWVEADGEVVALDEAALGYVGVNPAGAVLWKALAEGATRDALVAALLETFEVDEKTAAADVDAFVAELRRRDLLA